MGILAIDSLAGRCWNIRHPIPELLTATKGSGRPTRGALSFYRAKTWALEWIAVGSEHWSQPCAKAWRGMAEIQRTTKSHDTTGILGEMAYYEKVIKVKADVAAILINWFPS